MDFFTISFNCDQTDVNISTKNFHENSVSNISRSHVPDMLTSYIPRIVRTYDKLASIMK